MSRRRIRHLLAALLAGPLLAPCSCRHSVAPPPPGILRTADSQDVPTLDPAIGYDTTSWYFEQMLYSTLLDYDDENHLVPELASRWEESPDGLVYTFFLRPGVRFSNRQPLRAADVKYSIERVLRPQTRSQGAEFFAGIEGATAFVEGRADGVVGIEVLDDATLRFRLTAVDPLFLHKLAMQFAAVLPRQVAEAEGEDFGEHPVGSGPFVLLEWKRGQVLRLRRNPNYFRRGLPRLEGVDHLVGVNEQLEWLKFESGDIDVAAIPASEFPRVIRDPAYRGRLVSITSMTTNYLGMNCQVPPFNDVRVRQAVSLAIDRHKTLRLINDRGRVAVGILPPGMPDFRAIPAAADHDPQRARELLRQAGVPQFDTEIWTRTDETMLRLAQSFQQDLAEVGIQARIKNLSWASFLEAIRRPGLVPLYALAWQADFPDPSNFLEVLFHSRNIGSNNNAFFSDPTVDRLLDQAAQTVDAAARLALLDEAHQRIVEQKPWALLYYPITYQAVQSRVRNYHLHALRPPRLEEVDVGG